MDFAVLTFPMGEGQLRWRILKNENPPMRGDFDGDGKFDAAVFHPSNATWYIRNSSNGSIKILKLGNCVRQIRANGL